MLNVPVMEARVTELMQQTLNQPTMCPFTFDVAITWRTNQSPPFGKMELISPPEMMDAVLMKVASRITHAKDPTGEEELQQWHKVLRSCSFR